MRPEALLTTNASTPFAAIGSFTTGNAPAAAEKVNEALPCVPSNFSV
jgi:hypothetical protein